MSLVVPFLVWTCVAVFIATALITLLALVGRITLGGENGKKHSYYLNRLFVILLVQIVGISVAAYAAYLGVDQDQLQGLKELAGVPATSEDAPLADASMELSQPSEEAPGDELGLDVVEARLDDVDDGVGPEPLEETFSTTSTTSTIAPPGEEDDLVAAAPQTRVVEGRAYASSDGPHMDVVRVHIPEGWRYVAHEIVESTRNNRASIQKEELIRGPKGRTVAVEVRVSAEPRAPFGPRSWIGIRLKVTIERIGDR